MNIAVTIKQVPETSNAKVDPETGTMIREGLESIINPLDLYAIEEALKLKETYGGEITLFSMGPPKALEAIKEAISMGCDKGVLLTDRAFAGSDTWATSYVLGLAIKKAGGFHIIISGSRATDGDTGQVGPELAAQLGIPVATYVSRIQTCDGSVMKVHREVEEGYEILDIELPALLTVTKEINFPRLPTLKGKKKAKTAPIVTWGAEDLNTDKEKIGLAGSPTRVAKIFTPNLLRSAQMIYVKDEKDADEAVDKIIHYMESINIL